MKCPNCGQKKHIELDTHADGYAPTLLECGDCGAVWELREVRVLKDVLIQQAPARTA